MFGGNPFSARWRGNPVFPIARTVSFQTVSGALTKLIRGYINSNPIQAAALHRVQEILFCVKLRRIRPAGPLGKWINVVFALGASGGTGMVTNT